MRELDIETVAIVTTLQQMLYAFGRVIDADYGAGITEFYTEDGAFVLGDNVYRGRAAIAAFYEEHGRRIREQQQDGVRQVLHAFVNVRVAVEDRDNATVDFFNINYSAPGPRPVAGPIAPNMIVECHMACRREADGHWRIAEFRSVPQFVAGEAFVNRLLASS